MADTRFKPGQSGNPAGRPKGSRNKLGEAFIEALHADFQQYGAITIQAVRETDPVAYVKVCASILPKELNVKVDPFDELTDEQLEQRIRDLANALNLVVESGASEAAGNEEAQTRH